MEYGRKNKDTNVVSERGKMMEKKINAGTEGNRYEGDFVDGKRTGKGTFTWANGNRYEGDFVDGKLHGKGTFVDVDGNRYEGDFVDGKFMVKGPLRGRAVISIQEISPAGNAQAKAPSRGQTATDMKGTL
jgi:hypothetical protein